MDKISIHQFKKVDQFFKENKIDPNDSKKIRNFFYRRGFSFDQPINRVSTQLMDLAQKNIQTNFLTLVKRVDSKIDGATKLLFETHDGLHLEAVILRIASGRNSLCISCQCGCKFGCKFCATGEMGFKRNLTKDEILDQVVLVSKLLADEGKSLRNVVFMGMGEPLDNYKEVASAIEVLIDQKGFAFSPTNIMVSTCGLVKEMVDFSTRFPKVNLAISLHAATDQSRSKIMPINGKHTLNDLKAAISQINTATGQTIMLEYLLLQGVNDSEGDLNALIDFCHGLKVKVNLISYNSQGETDPFKCISQAETLQFQSKLKAQGLEVTLRYSLGQDIDAACGQLALKNSDETTKINSANK